MSKPATIHTISSLLARSNEVGKCHEWTGYLANDTPKVYHNGRVQAVRRVICELQKRQVPPKSFVSCSCGNTLCINPAHIIVRTMAEHALVMANQVEHQSPARLLKLTQKAQVRRKLTDEQLEMIRTDERSCAALAKEFQVNKSLVSRVRRGKSHRMATAKNNPFWSLYG